MIDTNTNTIKAFWIICPEANLTSSHLSIIDQ